VSATSRIVRRLFGAAAVAWAAALPAATAAAAQTAPALPAYLGAALVYAVGAVVCHQLPGRSFHLWGRQMPVCARCTGIYLGAALVAVAGFTRLTPVRLATWIASRSAGLAVIAAAPTVATLVVEWTTGSVPSNAVRAAAGVVLGAALAALVLAPAAPSDEVN
jgi:uncharacterized membrane protein